MKKTNRLVMGTALGLATIAVAIDHTRHKVPDAEPAGYQKLEDVTDDGESPCGMGTSAPCSMDSAPCSMDSTDSSPCGMGG